MTKKSNEEVKQFRKRLLPLNLQLFAESQEENDNNSEGESGEDNSAGESETPTLDDLLKNKDFQFQFDRRVTQAINTAKKKWEESLKEEADEAEKLEKMNAAQREQYELNKQKAAFEKEKADFAHQQLKTAVADELVKRGYSAEFSEFLTGDNAESSNANIDAFEKAFNKAVEAEVTNKMRGDYIPPSERQHNNSDVPPEDFHAYEKWRKENQ